MEPDCWETLIEGLDEIVFSFVVGEDLNNGLEATFTDELVFGVLEEGFVSCFWT